MQLEFVNEINTETKINKLLKGVSPYTGLVQSTPNEKWGKKNQQVHFIITLFYSFHSQTHFFFYKFKILVCSLDFEWQYPDN